MIGKKGLFGKKSYGMAEMPMPGAVSGFGGGTFNMDGTQATPMQQEITYTPKAQAIMSGEAPMPPKQGGGWKDILLGALGGAADGAATFFGGQPLIAQQRQLQQLMAQRQAEDMRRRSLDMADFERQMQIRQQYSGQQGPEIGTFEDNAGNVWRFDKASGQVIGDRPMFVDPNERVYFQDGAMVRVPNRFSQGQQGNGYAEGTVIENDQGQRMILRNGQWQPAGGTSGNTGGNFRP